MLFGFINFLHRGTNISLFLQLLNKNIEQPVADSHGQAAALAVGKLGCTKMSICKHDCKTSLGVFLGGVV